jgi:hypothetical protein
MSNISPTAQDELARSLSFALRFNGRKHVHDADETMARITAEQLVEHLELAGYVVMHKLSLGQYDAPENEGQTLALAAARPMARSRRANPPRSLIASRLMSADVRWCRTGVGLPQ